MLKWLAILTVVLTVAQTPIPTAGQTTNRSSSDGQKQDHSGDNHKNPSPATPRIVVKKASDGEDKTESQKAPGGYQNTAVNIANSAPVPESWPLHDRIAWGAGLILVLAGIAGTGIGVCTLWVLRRQTKANWAAAKAALKQANHIVTSERAWVLVCKIALTAGAIDHLEGSKQCFVSCAGKNYGKTPARVLGMNVLLASGPIADPEKSWDENLYDFSGKDTPKWIIVPSIPKPMYGLVKGFTTKPGDELPTPSVGEAYFVHGIIRYWDAFSETDRFTRFCYREDRDGSLLGKGWHIAGGERCNQET
jgi:hypothetical protein